MLVSGLSHTRGYINELVACDWNFTSDDQASGMGYWWSNIYGSVTQCYIEILGQFNFGIKVMSWNCQD